MNKQEDKITAGECVTATIGASWLLVGAVIAGLLVGGCQTRITAEKFAEKVTPIQKVVTVDGKDQVITTHAVVSSGGWYATARSPLWADETLRGLSLGVQTNGMVYLNLQDYHRDLSSNAVAVVDTLSNLTADIAGKVVSAVLAYYGGGAVTTSSKLGTMTISDVYGRIKAKLEEKKITAANASTADASAIAQEVVNECTGGNCPAGACADGSCEYK